MTATGTMEYLGAPRAGHRVPAVLLTMLVGVLVVVGVGFAWWSQNVGDSANTGLVGALAESRARVASGDRQVQGTLTYASPLIWSAAVPADVRAGLRTVVQDSAAEVAGDLAGIRASVAGITVLPWQGGQAEARDALLRLIDTQQQRFSRIAADATAIGTVLAEDPPSAETVIASLRASGAADLPLR